MRHLAGLVVFGAVLTLGGGVQAQTPTGPLPVHVGGRVIAEADGALSFGWPGVYFESRFNGAGVRVRFDAPAEYMRLLIDGQERLVFKRPGLVDVALEGLAPGEHVVRLEKLTESQSGGGRFIGFYGVGETTPLPVAARARQIEFIGDSYTVGYGNTSTTRTCTQDEIHDSTDTQQAFGPRVANRFGADYRINAYSGFGVIRNYNGGVRDLSLPAIYPRLKPDAADTAEAATGDWRPEVIVINLGTNDFSTPLHADEPWPNGGAFRAAYRERYIAFVRDLHAAQPQARFILMGSDAFIGEVEQVARSVNEGAPGLATPLPFGGLDRLACDWHPSLADEAILAGLIEAKIGEIGVWAGGAQ